jgi:GNAT superfamily N-acetyltransferase
LQLVFRGLVRTQRRGGLSGQATSASGDSSGHFSLMIVKAALSADLEKIWRLSIPLPRINLFLMIVPSTKNDFIQIYEIINDAASAYKGIIPEDRWHEPYMSETELQDQIDDGVTFWCYVENDIIIGVMGIQDKGDVTLIRHAYVRTTARNKGIGGKLLRHLSKLTTNLILVGTWADASWAIEFYKKYGFQLVSFEEKEKLLRKYWSIPLRQIETSVVLSSEV